MGWGSRPAVTHAPAGKPERRFFRLIPVKPSKTQGHRPCSPGAFAAGLSACLAGLPGLALAQQGEAPAAAQVVPVTALRTPAALSETIADVTLLTRADLDQASGLTLTQLLARQPGLQSAGNGGLGQTSKLFIRGLEARHTLLLIDGVRVGSATLGLPSLDNLPLTLIDHIEIVRGPLSSLYGSAAAGGVVQVFTRRAGAGLRLNGSATAGSLGYGQAAAGIDVGTRSLDLSATLQHTGDRGFSATNAAVAYGNHDPDRDGFQQDGASARAGWQLAPGWRLDALALGASGDVHFDDGPGADAHALLIDRVQSLRLSGQVSPAWRTGLSAARATDDYVTEASASATTALGATATRDRQFSWDNSVATPWGTALAVLDAETQQVSRPGAAFAVARRDIRGVALALDGAARGFQWQASLRQDHNSQFGHPATGALALGYALTPEWRVGASYGTSFVAPSFNQLYYPGYGNPALQPEHGASTELSARWTAGADAFHASWYRSRIRGFITAGEDPVNVAVARIEGLSLDGTTHWRTLTLQAALDHLDPRSQALAGSSASTQLPQRARNAARLNASWALEPATLGASWSAWSHRYNDVANTTRLGGYATLDLFAERRLAPEWSLGARMNNATGRVYSTAYGYNQPGREVFLTLRYAQR
jgi:vitamin B12 transporter